MPTVSLNERGVVVRGCDSSIPSIRVSRSLCSVADKGAADTGVNWEKMGGRLPSAGAEPMNEGDSVSVAPSSA